MNITPLKYIYQLISSYKKILYIIFLYALLKSFALIFPSYIIKNIIESIGSYVITKNIVVAKCIFLTIISYFFINNIFFVIFYLYQKFIYSYFFSYIRKKIVDEGICNIIYNSKTFFNNHYPNEIAHFLIHLQENTIDFLKLFIEKILPSISTFFFIIIILWYYNKNCGIILLIWFLIILILSYYILKNVDKYSINIIDEKVGITNYIIDILNNIMTIQIFSKQKEEINFLKTKTEILQNNEIINYQYFSKIDLFYFISFLIMEIVSCFVLYFQFEKNIINHSDIIFWWTISGTSYHVAQNFISDILNIPKYYYGIQEALLIINQKNNSSEKSSLFWKKGIIRFDNVSFIYENKKIIDNVSFTIESKQKIGIVGFSGSGKSTLILLLLRIYKPTTGTIYIDNQNIQDINIDQFYEKCSVVFQNNNIFSRSILENITYDNINDYDKKKYNEIIYKLQLSSINEKNTKIESLSGGEKQLINIGRSLFKKSSQIFIFDEPTSNLDLITEEIIINEINQICQNNTILMITHKLTLVKDYDTIFVFEKGKIIQNGNHTKLINEDGLYKTLWSLKEIN